MYMNVCAHAHFTCYVKFVFCLVCILYIDRFLLRRETSWYNK